MYLTILEKVESLIWGPTDYQKKRRGISKKKKGGANISNNNNKWRPADVKLGFLWA
jgi:hypothetical protein